MIELEVSVFVGQERFLKVDLVEVKVINNCPDIMLQQCWT